MNRYHKRRRSMTRKRLSVHESGHPKMWKPNHEIEKIVFKFNQSDNDPNPSVPHGDNAKYKLNTVTGEIIHRHNKKVYKTIDDCMLDRIYAEKGFQRVAMNSAAFFKEHFPWQPINSPLDKMKKKGFIRFGLDDINSDLNKKKHVLARRSMGQRKGQIDEFSIVINLEVD